MNPSEQTLRRSPIIREILAYLADHPRAQDTVEGIVEGWLLEQRIKRETRHVKSAVEQLVTAGFITAREGAAGRVYYRVNQRKLRNIRRLLRA